MESRRFPGEITAELIRRVLRGENALDEATDARIRRLAGELGYSPGAPLEATQYHQHIGILSELRGVGSLKHEYVSSVLSSIQDEAHINGYDVTLVTGGENGDYLGHCRANRLNGVAVVCVEMYSPTVLALINSEIPTVTVDYRFSRQSAVLSDNDRGMYDLVDYACDMGHRKLALIHGDECTVTRVRMAAFQRACEEHQLVIRPEWIRPSLFHDPACSAAATRELLALPDRPTCIFYPDDYSYLGGKQEIESQGLSIPQDISCIGFDGIALTQQIHPRLTTLHQDTQQIGQRTMELLRQAIEQPDVYRVQQCLIPGELYRGETVRRLNASIPFQI